MDEGWPRERERGRREGSKHHEQVGPRWRSEWVVTVHFRGAFTNRQHMHTSAGELKNASPLREIHKQATHENDAAMVLLKRQGPTFSFKVSNPYPERL